MLLEEYQESVLERGFVFLPPFYAALAVGEIPELPWVSLTVLKKSPPPAIE